MPIFPPQRSVPLIGSGPCHDSAVAEPLQVAGGSPGWQVAGRNPLKGKPETGINASVICPPANHPVPGLPLSAVSPLVPVPPCQLAPSRKRVSPCPLAPSHRLAQRSAAMSSHPFRYSFVSSASASGLFGNFMLAASHSSFTPENLEATLPSCTASVSGPA